MTQLVGDAVEINPEGAGIIKKQRISKNVLGGSMRTAILGFGFAVVLMASSAWAQQFNAAEFDAGNRVTKEGVVTRVVLQNPHVWIHFDVKDPSTGKVESWLCHTVATQSSWKNGDQIVVTGSPAKDGSRRMDAGVDDIKRGIGNLLATPPLS